jgi:glycogen operon protein
VHFVKVWPGDPYPLGATWDGSGVNFSLFSENASRVELCLFDHTDGNTEIARIPMPERTHQIWHAYLPEARPGWRYGYRVHGPYDPSAGHRFNPAKLLIDPYAKALDRTVLWNDAVFGYEIGNPQADVSIDHRDSAPYVPKAIVIDPRFDWEGDKAPRVRWHETVIYEAHVKGMTTLHPGVPPKLRGTYAGLATPVMLNYFERLGITAIELMPVHQFVVDRHLVERGLTNYWGYNSIGFLAPDIRYASSCGLGEQVREFKEMVKALHRAGIEVILDVVYNHTAEGNHFGPTLSFRGIDNASYYRLSPWDPRYYIDFTGCGNTLNMTHPRTLQLIMDSLRYWVLEMHVDGFRFDLAAALARELYEVDRLGAFFDIIYQDPVISQVKLIAEPWDLGEGGYQIGNFPHGWGEWNGQYRDTVRDYWRGVEGTLGDFSYRLTGSSDLYQESGRRPHASINFVTAHDGFTLEDLVSYNEKHNEANGDGNQDGESHNRSWNCGVEGPTDNPEVLALRRRQKKNLLTTLFLSQGVPMLLAGDEMGRTQRGNNNAYCQDNSLSWIDWQNVDTGLLEFVRFLIGFQRRHPVFRRRRWFQGRPFRGEDLADIGWFMPSGQEMAEVDWQTSFAKSLGVFLNGKAIPSPNERGERIIGDSFCILFNAHWEPIKFTIPGKWGKRWTEAFNTAETQQHAAVYSSGDRIEVAARSMTVLRHEN